MMHFNKNEGSEEILKTEMDYERTRSQKDGPCSRRTSILVLLGTVAMLISMIILFVICGDLVKRVTKMENLNKSSDPVTNDEDLRRLEERLINSLNEVKAQINTKLTSDKPVSNCKSGWIQYGSSCYLFSSITLNWMEARDYCKKQGASLLKFDGSDEEWEFVTHTVAGVRYWIGLTDQTTGQWRWTDDTPFTDDKLWEEGQPDDFKAHGEGEDCAHIWRRGKINDIHCSTKYSFICKTEPESN